MRLFPGSPRGGLSSRGNGRSGLCPWCLPSLCSDPIGSLGIQKAAARAAAAAAVQEATLAGVLLPPRHEPEAEHRSPTAPDSVCYFNIDATQLKEESLGWGFYLHFHWPEGRPGVARLQVARSSSSPYKSLGGTTRWALTSLVLVGERDKSNLLMGSSALVRGLYISLIWCSHWTHFLDVGYVFSLQKNFGE